MTNHDQHAVGITLSGHPASTTNSVTTRNRVEINVNAVLNSFKRTRRRSSSRRRRGNTTENTDNETRMVAFRQQVFRAVREIPFGRVSSYGMIARAIGYPRHARHVGHALKTLSISNIPSEELIQEYAHPVWDQVEDIRNRRTQNSMSDHHQGRSHVPWHRVLNSQGVISSRVPHEQMELQAMLLREEGIEVYQDEFNQYKIDMQSYCFQGFQLR